MTRIPKYYEEFKFKTEMEGMYGTRRVSHCGIRYVTREWYYDDGERLTMRLFGDTLQGECYEKEEMDRYMDGLKILDKKGNSMLEEFFVYKSKDQTIIINIPLLQGFEVVTMSSSMDLVIHFYGSRSTLSINLGDTTRIRDMVAKLLDAKAEQTDE